MTSVRSWLPFDAIVRGVHAIALRSCVRDWAATWFVDRQADVVGDAHFGPAAVAGGAAWRLGDGLAVSLAADAATRVAVAMYGAPDDGTGPTEADRAALDVAAETCLDDLRQRVAALLGEDVGAGWRRDPQPGHDAASWTWPVVDDGGVLLEIAVSEDLIAKRVRRALPVPPAVAPISSFATALAPEPVQIAALVGRGRLTTTELAGLAPGDVLVLDRDLGSAVEIAVGYSARSLRCTVDREDDRLQLTLV